jgi:lysophospholipase L1-like esterase
MVILSLGTNDAYGLKFNPEEYKNNYDTLIQRILSVNKNTAILITVPNDDYYKKRYPNKNTELQEKVIYELATKYNAGIWNLYKIMGGFNSSQKWYLNKLMRSDRIHFTSKGYILKGQLFFNAFLNSYNNFIDKDFNLLKNESKLKSD